LSAVAFFFQKWTGALFALLLAVCALPAGATELVMFERSGCVWCLRWEREIGPIYPKTEEGRIAPLRHVSLDRGPPTDMALAEPVFYTPTFVLMDEGREVGRITGYLGEDAFWGLLGQMVGRLGRKPIDQPAPKKAFFSPIIPLVPVSAGMTKSDE
jgi:hypothetical protein